MEFSQLKQFMLFALDNQHLTLWEAMDHYKEANQ
jgi:hypothetical protein